MPFSLFFNGIIDFFNNTIKLISYRSVVFVIFNVYAYKHIYILHYYHSKVWSL